MIDAVEKVEELLSAGLSGGLLAGDTGVALVELGGELGAVLCLAVLADLQSRVDNLLLAARDTSPVSVASTNTAQLKPKTGTKRL